mmetsp:Transcript_6795/g.11433  ORF Transcript_6795/g.11433 Transcript_6795/m.11433 type:complete len:179 (+) Transcript_6795:97-633(+)
MMVSNEQSAQQPTHSVQFELEANIIPLIIDYILVHELAEERSLAYTLQIDENEVRKALDKLVKHELLCTEQIYAEFFKNKYLDKLGLHMYYRDLSQMGPSLSMNAQQDPLNPQSQINSQGIGSRNNKVDIYYFNVNIIYILTARLFTLEQMLTRKLNLNRSQGNMYSCPNSWSATGEC